MSYYINAAQAAKTENIHSFAQVMVLGILSESADGICLSYLARSVGITSAAMTGLADKLERLRMVKRKTNPHDRRTYRLTITNKGRATFKQILP